MRARYKADCEENDRYGWYLDRRYQDLSQGAERYLPELSAIPRLKAQHAITNAVRHEFAALHEEEARCAVELLARFARLDGFQGLAAMGRLEEGLRLWDDKRTNADLLKELSATGFRLIEESRRSAAMARRLSEYEETQATALRLADEKRALAARLSRLEEGYARKDERVNGLRRENHELELEMKTLSARAESLERERRENRQAIESLAEVKAYIDGLARASIYTRTRFDYERRICRLSEEQKRAVEGISLDADALVKGAAGTGKTLVLLKALEKAGNPESLGLEAKSTKVLITYTKSLVKYDAYLAQVLLKDPSPAAIQTIDAYFTARLGEVIPGARIAFGREQEVAEATALEGLRPDDLAREAEKFVWAKLVSREEYVDGLIERTGMRKPLRREERAFYWKGIAAMEARMEAEGIYSRNYARVAFLRALREDCPKLSMVDYSFIDEVQDLAACDLAAVKRCTRRCAILAGDSDQSLYQTGFGFRRAGLDISGRTRILRTNYRNSVQIHELAERYRAATTGRDSENLPEAFRIGPPPELIEGRDAAELLDLLCARITLFTTRLGYERGNIAVFAPQDKDLLDVEGALAIKGIPAKNVKAEDFAYEDGSQVRLSTLHSAKGLDFPVVLLYLPRMLPPDPSLSDEASERLHRNLIYVALTRALDQVSVFCLERTTSRSLLALKECFRGIEEGEGEKQEVQDPPWQKHGEAESE